MATILTTFLNQFRTAHQGKDPASIVIAPVAALELARRNSLSSTWCGITVTVRLFENTEVVSHGLGTQLGIFVKEKHSSAGNGKATVLAACELR
jgi:hypothetical protein